MKKLQAIILSVFAIIGIAAAPVPVFAANGPAGSIKEGVDGVGGGENQPKLEEGIKTVVNVLLFLLGAIAVIMIIIGGIRYATSNGDAGQTKAAKDTILYAVIGLVVAILAYAIVNFVIDAFSGSR
jgi:hypothetical protein